LGASGKDVHPNYLGIFTWFTNATNYKTMTLLDIILGCLSLTSMLDKKLKQ